jgi:hypothetical protein
MEALQERFHHCDQRFYPHIETVLNRLPREIKAKILTDRDFQIMAHDGFQDSCVQRRRFVPPAQTLVYLNTKLLREPEHFIHLAIASQIAFYVAGKDQEAETKEAEALLRNWGFTDELNAVRFDQQVAKSEGFRVGYGWAKGQNKDYLRKHFGLYLDAWNAKGLGKPSEQVIEELDRSTTSPILEQLIQMTAPESAKAQPQGETETIPPQQSLLAGIMTALKEIAAQEQANPQVCDIRSI